MAGVRGVPIRGPALRELPVVYLLIDEIRDGKRFKEYRVDYAGKTKKYRINGTRVIMFGVDEVSLDLCLRIRPEVIYIECSEEDFREEPGEFLAVNQYLEGPRDHIRSTCVDWVKGPIYHDPRY